MGLLESKMSSASLHTSLKVALEKVIWAIPAFTSAGSWRFHKALMTSGQQVQSNSDLQMSLTKALAS